jgi:hypothetical protein
MLHAMFLASLQQRPAVGRVVAVILQRIGHRLRHDRVCREMHDRINLVLGKDFVQQFRIAGVADDQLAGFDGGLEAGTEVVQRYDRFAGLTELAHDVAADISGATGARPTIVNHLLPTRPDSINTKVP